MSQQFHQYQQNKQLTYHLKKLDTKRPQYMPISTKQTTTLSP